MTPIDTIIRHLDSLDWSHVIGKLIIIFLNKFPKKLFLLEQRPIRLPILNLRNNALSIDSCETLEEILKRVQYESIDVSSCQLDDNSASALFDMVEYYEAAIELNVSDNERISYRGWQACANMVKRCQSLRILTTKRTPIVEQYAKGLGNALLVSSIHTLKLEQCGLTGRPISSLLVALSKNTVLKELYLASNDLNCYDAYSIATLLRNNIHLQFLDISNNKIQDNGVSHIALALIEQSANLQNTILNHMQKTMPKKLTESLSSDSLSSEFDAAKKEDAQRQNDQNIKVFDQATRPRNKSQESDGSGDSVESSKSPQDQETPIIKWDKPKNDPNNNVSESGRANRGFLEEKVLEESANVDNAEPVINNEKILEEEVHTGTRDINENLCKSKSDHQMTTETNVRTSI